MFFLLRSAFCIALVVSCLPKSGDDPAVASAAHAAKQWVAASITQACTGAPGECARLISQDIAPMARKISLDTLIAADLEPAWAGPGAARRN